MGDFKSTVYYPAKAYTDGVNPYDAKQYLARYPAPEPVRLYPPATLLAFQPFASIPLPAATRVQAVLTVLLSGVLAYVSLRLAGAPARAPAVLLVWALILLSRPGQWNLLQGQMTLPIVLGIYAALATGRRSRLLAGAGLAIALLKPNFGLPLMVLMLARGQFAGVAVGAGVTGLLNLVAMRGLVTQSGGLPQFLTLFHGTGDRLHTSAHLGSELNVFRVDGVGLVSRLWEIPLGLVGSLIAGAGVLGLIVIVLHRRAVRPALERPFDASVVGLICSGILVSIYHIGYDLLLLTWPFVALVVQIAATGRRTPVGQWVALGLFAILAGNYLATATVIEGLGSRPMLSLTLASLNGAALLGLFAFYLHQVVRSSVRVYQPVPL
jgi:hypothetical protein